MDTPTTPPDTDIAHYEGLVRSTASRYVSIMAGAAMDFEDICQVLRIKVWKALEAYDPARCNKDRRSFVFMCVRNQGKDLVKRRAEDRELNSLHIEDVAPTVNGNGAVRDRFEMRYLQSAEDVALRSALEEAPLIPSTLSTNERRVLAYLYVGYGPTEIVADSGLSKPVVTRAIRAIREKMSDWKPTTDRESTPDPACVPHAA